MPLERPTLPELVARIVGDVDTRLPALFARVPQNPANVFCDAVAGMTHGAYGYIDQQMVQVLPTTATGPYLAAWGKMLGLTIRPATFAVVPLSIVATTLPTTMPIGTLFRRSDGTLYETIEELSATTNPFAFSVTALEAGAAGTVTTGTVLAMTPFIPALGVSATATADGEGEDDESEETYRGRILAEFRVKPQGGADADYIKWAKEVPGVGYAWVVDSAPPYVDLRIATNDENDLTAGVPLKAAVQAYILDVPLKRRKPVNAILLTASIIVTPQAFTFSVFTPNTLATRTTVDAALAALLVTIRTPGTTLRKNAVIAAIENTGVLTAFTLTVPAADVVYGPSEIPTMGTVTR